MKITIYVSEKYLENLYQFLRDGEERPIEYFASEPHDMFGPYYAVTIDYRTFVKLEDLSE